MAASTQNGARAGVYRLGAIAAPDIRFELNDMEWRIPADPDVEQVALMLQLEREIKAGDVDESGGRSIAQAIVDSRDLIVDLLAECKQEQPVPEKFRIGVGEILVLFALVTGGPTVADAVADGLTAGMAAARDDDDLTDEEREALAAGEADESPLPSTKPSSKRRSGSAESTSGRRRGGGA